MTFSDNITESVLIKALQQQGEVELSPEMIAQSADELLDEIYPMRTYVPHRGQRAFHRMTDNISIMTGANKVGKTAGGMTGEACWAITNQHPIKDKWRHSTKNNLLRLRFISTPENFAENIQPLIEAKLPPGCIVKRKRDSAGYDKYWRIEGEHFWAKCQFLSVGQSINKFESVILDGVFSDEPISYAQHQANVTRLSAGTYSIPRMIFTLTPLEGDADWMSDEFFDEAGSPLPGIGHVNVPVWDNCLCLHPREHDFNDKCPLNEDRRCTCHGGYLHKDAIDDMIKNIRDPMQKKARILGEFVFKYRRLIPNYDPKIHMFDPDKMPDWTRGRPKHSQMFIVIDPHDAYQDAIQYWCVDKWGQLYLLWETPNYFHGTWAGVKFQDTRSSSFEVMARDLVETVYRFDIPVMEIGADPHFSQKEKSRDSSLKVYQAINDAIQELNSKLPQVQLVNPDKEGNKEIIAGHRMIREWLEFDRTRDLTAPEDIDFQRERRNCPKILISKNCYHTNHAYLNYRRKKGNARDDSKMKPEEPEELVKHWVDDTRYMISMRPTYTDFRLIERSYASCEPPSPGVI